jgi:hypothetical protein
MNQQQIHEEIENAKNCKGMFEDAQRTLSDGLQQLIEAVEALEDAKISTDEISAASLDSYIVGHLSNWIEGGNPYDDTLPTIINSLDNYIEAFQFEEAPDHDTREEEARREAWMQARADEGPYGRNV